VKAITRSGPHHWSSADYALLVFFAGIMLLFTGRYPKSLYDFVLMSSRKGG
jgi:hypothetical protein